MSDGVQSPTLEARWASGEHVGAAGLRHRALIRTGTFIRGYGSWPTADVGADIFGEARTHPWMATWTPDSEWVEIPNVLSIDTTQDFDSNGIEVLTLVMDNILYPARVGPLGELYHLIDRGGLSPFRTPVNEWYGQLSRNAQVFIEQGYGDDAMVPAFTGLIDDCDLTSSPDRITLTVRDFGQTLADQDVFGWSKSPQLPEPTVFQAGALDKGEGVGYDAKASSSRDGHPPRFVTDQDTATVWISDNHNVDAATEWVEVRVPKGRYESIAIHAAYPGMEMFVGVYARKNGLGGEKCELDDDAIDDGWVFAGEGTVPGDNGGWPYVARFAGMSDKGHTNQLGHVVELGDDSVVRVGFRSLGRITADVYRAGVVRFAPIRRKGMAVALRPVGDSASASSARDGHDAKFVTDNDRSTTWISDNHTVADVTEWVQIRVPKGRYDSVALDAAYPGMVAYFGVYARQGRRKNKCRMDGQPIDDGFVAAGAGVVPGDNGGWPFVNVENAAVAAGSTKYDLNHTFELGDDSVIRVGFRQLGLIQAGVYRASVRRFQAWTRKTPEDPPTKAVRVSDIADIVKVTLRWAGFTEWRVENANAEFSGKLSYNRANKLVDIIADCQKTTGFVFHMAPPTSRDSIGVPVFRSNLAIAHIADIRVLTDQDLLTGVQVKSTDEPLGYIIRVRGKESEKYGKTLGNTSLKQLMAVYRPPWTLNGRLAGLLKHVVLVNDKLRSSEECMVMAQLYALQEALASVTATVEIPGQPLIELNEQVYVEDAGTGLLTRLYIAQRSSSYRAGENASWKTTLGGALIDTPDALGVIADLRATLAARGVNPDAINLGDPFGA